MTGGAADLPGPDDIDTMRSGTAATPPASGEDAAEAERLAVQAFGARNPTCLAWGDGCVTCLAEEAGKPVCNNPGPACTPRETACTRRRDVPPEPAK
ncbi:hypothetical protein CH341_24155 [Rhodoplanes roseus]|uniref:Uncharacterized protein n=1 Tax=Rhodoplanes roseus TaxID=29409 RepID=A0A327KRI3_9BRAD|nr:hypothetical protein CH341_24155 [Rhodoplanes roseus]